MAIISGGGGGGGAGALSQLFTQTLAAPAAVIDTGANGIAQTASNLLIVLSIRTDDVATFPNVALTLNADTGANYDRYSYTGTATTWGQGSAFGGTSWTLNVTGASADAGVFGYGELVIPDYTSAIKHMCSYRRDGIATAANANALTGVSALRHLTVAAISRATFTAAGGQNFVAGSRVSIYGML